jgi:hypothetical protein
MALKEKILTVSVTNFSTPLNDELKNIAALLAPFFLNA